MKRELRISLFVLFLFLLSGCGKDPVPETRIQVSILESQGFTVENNGQYIHPGENVVFLLNMDPNVSLADTNYNGIYYTTANGSQLELTLKNVRYPTHVALQLTSRYATITYDPNDGSGGETAVTYDTSLHLRPNTSTGNGLFARDGYTLVSWNTQPDGMGERIGLGSRTSVSESGLTLYAQWEPWCSAADFDYSLDGGTATITGYHGSVSSIVVPAAIDGRDVTAIASGAFRDCSMTEVILPATIGIVEAGAFQNCTLETVTLFDSIDSISDDSFTDCVNLTTLRINAIEAPYGYNYRRESCYADKIDLLIQAQGHEKIVFYGGCSTWYNLDSSMLSPLLESGYRVVNLGLNGTVNSSVQMQILGNFLERGDILIHTPELSSLQQMLVSVDMTIKDDGKLWCGLEYNYDLFALVDLRTIPGVFDTFCHYLSRKGEASTYNEVYRDSSSLTYCDEYGCIPFYRVETQEALSDQVYLDPSIIDNEAMARLRAFYDQYQAKGARVYISYACVNMDDVPAEQQGNVDLMDQLFREAVEGMDGPVLISTLEDFLYRHNDFYDTNYHLLSEPARKNTAIWLRDLLAQMTRDGLWEES